MLIVDDRDDDGEASDCVAETSSSFLSIFGMVILIFNALDAVERMELARL